MSVAAVDTTKQTQSNPTFVKGQIKVLLLEGVNQTGVAILEREGYSVEYHLKALSTETLIEKIKDVHIIGIRSKTLLTAEILAHAQNLMAIGCFCIGTNQVDLLYAASRGICVFNSPFSNSRSVAELVVGEIIALSRQMGDWNQELHFVRSLSNFKSPGFDSHEIRGKTLGIVGYGHIGSQLSVIADSLGMKVVFYDILSIMPLGTAKPLGSLNELLQVADFVTLHVPETDETKDMIGAEQIRLMKPGSYLINASRGTVVVIPDLVEALNSGHLAGTAVDVFPVEPYKNGPGFDTPLIGCRNTILTPHIGGSTEEAQSAIGIEVAGALAKFIATGTSVGAVNFPEVDVRQTGIAKDTVRIVNCHKNVPGVLKQINRILSEFNIEKQSCDSKGAIAYLIAEIRTEDAKDPSAICRNMSLIPENIVTRILGE